MYWDGPLMRILPLEKRRLVGGVVVTVRECGELAGGAAWESGYTVICRAIALPGQL